MSDPEGYFVGAGVSEILAIFAERATGESKPVPLRLVDKPWLEASEVLGGGLWPGLYVLVGGTGSGKTQLGLSLALGAALAKSPVAYVNLDSMQEVELEARLCGLVAGQPWSDLYLGRMKPNRDYESLLEGLPFFVVEGDALKWAPDQLATVAQELVTKAEARGVDVKKHRPLIVLDYLQLCGQPQAAKDPLDIYDRTEMAARYARHIAKQHGVAIIAISSTARKNYDTLRISASDTMPDPATLVGMSKESEFVELVADGVFVMLEHTDAKSPTPARERLLTLSLAKHTSGPEANLHLAFDGSQFRPVSRSELQNWSGVCKRGAAKTEYKNWRKSW